MSTLQVTPAVTSQVTSGDQPWSGTSVVLNAGQDSHSRRHAIGSALDALHDGCEVTSIAISASASCNVSLAGPNQYYAISFAGVGDTGSGTSTTLSASGGAGTPPATIRAGEVEAYAWNQDSLYNVTDTIGLITVTVTYTDNGLPGMLQFSL